MKTTSRTSRTFFFALLLAGFLAFPAPARAANSVTRSLWAPIEWAFSSQRRVLQVGTVAVCFAIYMIAWKK